MSYGCSFKGFSRIGRNGIAKIVGTGSTVPFFPRVTTAASMIHPLRRKEKIAQIWPRGNVPKLITIRVPVDWCATRTAAGDVHGPRSILLVVQIAAP